MRLAGQRVFLACAAAQLGVFSHNVSLLSLGPDLQFSFNLSCGPNCHMCVFESPKENIKLFFFIVRICI